MDEKGGLERGHSPWRPPHQPEFSSWEATAAHTCLHADAHSRVSPFPEYYILLGDRDSLKTEKKTFFEYLKILRFLSQKIKGLNFMETPRIQTPAVQMIHPLSQHTLLIIQTLSLFISFHLTF